MESLANLTQTDINNGKLIGILINVGIPDVEEYVKNFHHETEKLIVEELQVEGSNKVENHELIISPAEIKSWISGFRPDFNTSSQVSVPKEQQEKKQSTPEDIQQWIARIRPHADGVTEQPLPPTQQKQQQQPKRNTPTDIKSWMQHTTPVGLLSSNENTTDLASPTINISNEQSVPLSGNLSTWLTDWSRSLTEQPPPTSLDTWLQRLVPHDLHEPLTKANSSKGRLNTYLNAAQQVLSQHGYDVSTQPKPSSTTLPTKTGKFANVKQMYFLWKVLDKNNDRKITVEDVEIMLEEMGFNFISKPVAKALFDMVDGNHDGVLQFRDFVAFMGLVKELSGAMVTAKA